MAFIWWLIELPIHNTYFIHFSNHSIFNIYFYASGMFNSKLFPRHLCFCAFTFSRFIYHSLTVSHVCLMGFRHYQPLLPHLMPVPFSPGRVPTLVSHLFFCVAHWASVGLRRNLKSCVLFPCVGTGKCKHFYWKRKSCFVF